MFDKIFGLEAIRFMISINEGIETIDNVERFRQKLIDKIEYNTLMMLGRAWSSMDELGQVKVAIRYVGESDASRFMIYLDYLSEKIQIGEIK